MKITLTNVEEAGMEPGMAEECRILIGRRIDHAFDGKASPGDDVTVLYDPVDPLSTSEEVSDGAYFIYFTVAEVRPDGEVLVDLEY